MSIYFVLFGCPTLQKSTVFQLTPLTPIAPHGLAIHKIFPIVLYWIPHKARATGTSASRLPQLEELRGEVLELRSEVTRLARAEDVGQLMQAWVI